MNHNTKNGNEILRHVHYDQRQVMRRLDYVEEVVDTIATNVNKLVMYHKGISKKTCSHVFPSKKSGKPEGIHGQRPS